MAKERNTIVQDVVHILAYLIGCFPGVSVVAAKEFGIDQPETIPLVRSRRSRSRWKFWR
jgi:hypothetical protein